MKFILSLMFVAAAASVYLPAAGQTPAAKKPASKAVAKPSAKSTAKPAMAATAAATSTAALSSEQLGIAQIVQTGAINCADGQKVTITADAVTQGAFDLQFGRTKYDVIPMPTKSGAIRLEDAKTGVVYMQLANKSMLFNERQGKRLADDCISPEQQAVADSMKANPTAGVLDSPTK